MHSKKKGIWLYISKSKGISYTTLLKTDLKKLLWWAAKISDLNLA